MLPGAGATLSTFIAYNLEKRICKHPERLGTGDIREVANPESANNSASGASLVPLLTLGLPGDGATAVMLGALMMLDITPGPLMFQRHGAMSSRIFWCDAAHRFGFDGAMSMAPALPGVVQMRGFHADPNIAGDGSDFYLKFSSESPIPTAGDARWNLRSSESR